MDDYVGLNVGGKIYRTSRSTFLRHPDSFFDGLLSGSVPSIKDDQGNYLIDQDGKIFRHILNFLRYGELVLPEGFKEFDLLEREADFFLLQELKLTIKEMREPSTSSEPTGITLVFDDGKVFHTTRETLTRDKGSYFKKMLSGEVAVPRDYHGNYIMDRDGRLFHHIMGYLRDGGIFSEIQTEDLDRLEREAEHFGLPVLASHVYSIRANQQGKPNPASLHLYSRKSTCVVYAHHTIASKEGFSSCFDKKYKIHQNVFSAITQLPNSKGEGPAIQDVIRQIFQKPVASLLQKRVSANCTMFEVKA